MTHQLTQEEVPMAKVLILGTEETAVEMLRLAEKPLWHEVEPALIPAVVAPALIPAAVPLDKGLSCGLLAPSGKYYECDYYGHIKLSEEILVLNPTLRGVRTNPEEILRLNGWAKVSGQFKRNFTQSGPRLTPPQLDFLLTNRNNFALTYQLQILEESEGQWH
ncbi:MAG: hypothetical protein JW395_0774 [Nitrospira sp.]|nr:hypothetical protein [Nitrospira sp.]